MSNKKKCIVVDLDNTLWGGVVGEDGLAGIRLSVTEPGAYFVALQQVLLDYFNRGIILAINSKNNEEDVQKVFAEHPDMVLQENNFAAMRINWNDKAENIKEIAAELNIGTDAMVFLDDDPFQRELVRTALPEVVVPELPQDPKEYAQFVATLPFFPISDLTEEDKMRGNLYVTERLRRENEKQYVDRASFLKNLNIVLQVQIDVTDSLSRVAQLTERTNQFNTNKVEYSEADLRALVAASDQHIVQGVVQDRFGDSGLVAVAILKKQEHTWLIQSLLMSCRVLGRGAEEAFLNALIKLAADANVTQLKIDFKQSEKNTPAMEFVEKYFDNYERAVDATSLDNWVTIQYG